MSRSIVTAPPPNGSGEAASVGFRRSVMNSDPHPLVGWARFLEWQKSASGALAAADAQRLKEAVNKAIEIYNYWRPELRYKVIEITESQLNVVRRGNLAQRESAQILGGVTCRSFVVVLEESFITAEQRHKVAEQLAKELAGEPVREVDRSSSRFRLNSKVALTCSRYGRHGNRSARRNEAT